VPPEKERPQGILDSMGFSGMSLVHSDCKDLEEDKKEHLFERLLRIYAPAKTD
jgi:hypothetical protein